MNKSFVSDAAPLHGNSENITLLEKEAEALGPAPFKEDTLSDLTCILWRHPAGRLFWK